MCRLLAVRSRGPIFYDLFEEFADLAWKGNTPLGEPDERGHKDGWGFAFYHNGDLVRHERESGAANEDSRYFGAAWKVAKTNAERREGEDLILIAHIRRASPDMPVQKDFSHPFTANRRGRTWSFAHNGGLGGGFQFEDRGGIDSQYLFRILLDNLDADDPKAVAEAMRRTRKTVREEFPKYSALNVLLSDGHNVHAVRDFATRGTYYSLYEDDLGDMVVVCSEPILDMKDNPVANGTMLTIGPDLKVVHTKMD